MPGLPSTNTVYYRMSAPPPASDSARMQEDVSSSFPDEPVFAATMIGVFTWFSVGRFSSRTDMLDTFQVTIAHDSGGARTWDGLPREGSHKRRVMPAVTTRSFVTLCYDNMIWHQGDANPSECCARSVRGLRAGRHGARPRADSNANAGFNSASGLYYSLTGVFMSADVRLSCGGKKGCYTFRVDQSSVKQPSQTSSPTPSPSASSTVLATQSPMPTLTINSPVALQQLRRLGQAACSAPTTSETCGISVAVMNGAMQRGMPAWLAGDLSMHAH